MRPTASVSTFPSASNILAKIIRPNIWGFFLKQFTMEHHNYEMFGAKTTIKSVYLLEDTTYLCNNQYFGCSKPMHRMHPRHQSWNAANFVLTQMC